MNSQSAAPDRNTSPAKISLRQSADPRFVLADRVEQLYSQMPVAVAGTFAIGVLATYELREGRYIEIVLAWGGLVVLLTLMRIALYWGYRRSKDRIGEAAQWLRWLGISAFATGSTWGFAAAVFFPSHADEQQVFLAFLLSVLVGGGIPIYAVSWPIYAVYAAGILFPFAYVLATFGNKLFAEIALIVPAFYVLNVGIAFGLTRVYNSGYRLRHAYGKLTEDYSALNQRLEQQLVELGEARRQVEASGRKLALFAERSPIAVFELDPEGRIQQVNPAAELLFGYPLSELAGQAVSKLILPQYHAEFEAQWRALIANREPLTGLKLRNPRRDGISIVCEWTVTPLVNAAGEIVAVIAQGRDVTQQLEAERMKKEFTSTLSHELRTPLTSIIGSLQLINSGVLGDIDKDVLELTTIAERNGQRLLDLINDVLDVEKIESGKLTLFPEPLLLSELVAESLALNRGFADRYKVRLAASGELPLVKVNADRKRLLQIMTNLLSNAAKFSPEGATVLVTMQPAADGNVRVGVDDSGPGIPENFRNRIFGRFAQADMSYTRQKGGTGLGLAICKRLIEMMGGKIGFSDRSGGGTTFWFELPQQS